MEINKFDIPELWFQQNGTIRFEMLREFILKVNFSFKIRKC